MIDIDYFKNYNDLYGHPAGDSCLQKIAHTIRASLRRAGNFLARYGGEEFMVILPDTNAEEAYLFAEYLREKIENLNIEHKDSKIGKNVTISLGASTAVPKNMMNSYFWLIRLFIKQSRQDEIVWKEPVKNLIQHYKDQNNAFTF